MIFFILKKWKDTFYQKINNFGFIEELPTWKIFRETIILHSLFFNPISMIEKRKFGNSKEIKAYQIS